MAGVDLLLLVDRLSGEDGHPAAAGRERQLRIVAVEGGVADRADIGDLAHVAGRLSVRGQRRHRPAEGENRGHPGQPERFIARR